MMHELNIENPIVIGIAAEKLEEGLESHFDLSYIETRVWNDATRDIVHDITERFKFFQGLEFDRINYVEYPVVDSDDSSL